MESKVTVPAQYSWEAAFSVTEGNATELVGRRGEVGVPVPTVAQIALALPPFPPAASVSYSLPSLLRCTRSRLPSTRLSPRAYAAWASCSHFIFSSVTRRGINHVFRGGHSAIYLPDTSSIQRPVAGHSPLSSKITHYFAPLLLPALSIDWLFDGGIKLARSDIIYSLHVGGRGASKKKKKQGHISVFSLCTSNWLMCNE